MRVLVAGATGVIGRQLVPLLRGAGHEPIALARSTSRAAELDVPVVVADALDGSALRAAVGDAAPDVVVHLLTAIPAEVNPRHMSSDFATTTRLRTEGTRNLIDAAGGARLISQSIAFGYEPAVGLADEDAPWWSSPPKQFAAPLAGVRELEQQTAAAGGLSLRFGHLYGPGSAFAADGTFTDQVRARKFPVVGDGGAVFSFTHARDAASAVVAAVDKPATGALNIVDDDPAAVHTWLPELARLLGARAPSRVPALLARPVAGGWGVAFLTRLRGADNARARLALDWRPGTSSWREGFATELGGAGG